MNTKKYRHLAAVAVSGTGKGTVLKMLRTIIPELQLPVSATTRNPRPNEQNGVHYHFYSWWKFIFGIITGKFIEWNYYNSNLYGTLYSEVLEKDVMGILLVFDIDINGAIRLKKFLGDKLITVFLDCPIEESEKRLRGRKTESEKYIQKRLKIGKQKELPRKHECDEIVWYGAGADIALTANKFANLMLVQK